MLRGHEQSKSDSLGVGRLVDKVAIITGGASGIGRATARKFEEEGSKVVVADIDRAAGESAAAEIRDAGGRAIALHVDVADASSFDLMLTNTSMHWGKLNVLVNNAGIAMRRTPALKVTNKEWDRQLLLNLTSVWNGCRLIAPHLKKEGGGSIVNVSSLAALKPRPGFSAYAAAKAGVVALTQVLAQEFAPSIRVNSVSPVSTDTPMLSRLLPEGQSIEKFKTEIRSGIPAGRLNRPGDVALAIVYLASDEAAMVNGHNLVISGGVG